MSTKETLMMVVKKLAGLQTGATACCGGGGTLTPSTTESCREGVEAAQGRSVVAAPPRLHIPTRM